jgi:carnitine O-acetyltransferase
MLLLKLNIKSGGIHDLLEFFFFFFFVFYCNSVRPLASDSEYAATEKAVNEFLKEGGDGQALQAMLQQHSDAEWAQGRNWLEAWWLQFAYLMWPDPLPLNSNVFFYFITITPTEHIFQAARLLSTFLSAKDKIDKEELPVEFTGARDSSSVCFFY